ncbi:MAG: adenosylcobinamide-GDP ribazoletransferase [Spirochaetaceae bacterium]|nr:adenosylcobinamide-GDP ribazoletransferase [Spirochaetaceae bacterium]
MVIYTVITALLYAVAYEKALGGYSGDALGAAIETGEELCLLFATTAFNFT